MLYLYVYNKNLGIFGNILDLVHVKIVLSKKLLKLKIHTRNMYYISNLRFLSVCTNLELWTLASVFNIMDYKLINYNFL